VTLFLTIEKVIKGTGQESRDQAGHLTDHSISLTNLPTSSRLLQSLPFFLFFFFFKKKNLKILQIIAKYYQFVKILESLPFSEFYCLV
jgi:hypothetical protein